MNEIPQPYQKIDQHPMYLLPQRGIETLAAASLIFDASTIESLCQECHIVIDSPDIDAICNLMTQPDVLNQNNHEREIISPVMYPSFTALRKQRDRIRDLRLVPQRSGSVQEAYMRLDRTSFLSLIGDHYLRNSPLSYVKELYPSDLSSDIRQSVVWTDEQSVDNRQIAEFIAKIVKLLNLTPDDVILFERSRTTETDYVKVAIPEYRHIHMWTRHQGETIL
jgi:hypothetical protein